MDDKVITIEQEFNASSDSVWRALTEKKSMEKWYFDISDFKPEIGFKFQFEGGQKDKRYVHLCEVVETIPNKKITYSWTYQDYTGLSFVSFELFPEGNKTTLKLTHEGLETFTNPDFSKDKFVDGWKYLIHESLKEFLENGKALRSW